MSNGDLPADPRVVAEQVQRELTRIGSDQKKAHDDLQREIHALRGMAEEAKENRETIANLKGVFDEKFGHFEKLVTDVKGTVGELQQSHDQLAVAYKRGGFGGATGSDAEFKDALQFEQTLLTMRGADPRLKVDPDSVDTSKFEAYRQKFETVLRRDEKTWGPEEHKTLMVASDPNGGYLVPPALSNRIITNVYESSPMRQLATVEQIGTDALELPVDLGEFEAGWVGETQPRPETATSTLGTRRLLVHEQYAQPAATQKFLEDATIDVERWIADKIADRFARLEATSFIIGDGINKPRGILTYPAGTGYGQIEQIASGVGAAPWFAPDNLVALPFSLKEPYHANASWLFKRVALASLVTVKAPGSGEYFFQLVLRAGAGERGPQAQNIPSAGLLLGYPVRTADDMPAPALNALAGAFGDFRRAYTVVDRLGITTQRDSLTLKPFVLFYTRRRVGGDVVHWESVKLLKITT